MIASLNDYFLVTLTEAGERAWANYWATTHPKGVPNEIRKANTLSDGRVKFQIWAAMNIFGPDCYMGNNEIPFVNNKIEIVTS
jgi:hypothetical protein